MTTDALHQEKKGVQTCLPSFYARDEWVAAKDGDPRLKVLYDRHYSARRYRDSRTVKKVAGPGEYLAFVTPMGDAAFVWKKFRNADPAQTGVMCSIFRNEGPALSSDLIRRAMALAWERCPGERLYTYVNPGKISSSNPGYCFLRAGWRKCGMSKGGLVVLEVLP